MFAVVFCWIRYILFIVCEILSCVCWLLREVVYRFPLVFNVQLLLIQNVLNQLSGLVLPGQRKMQRSADGWTPGGFRLGIQFGLGVRLFNALFPCGYVPNFIPLTSPFDPIWLFGRYAPWLTMATTLFALETIKKQHKYIYSTTRYSMAPIDPFRCWNHVVGVKWPAYARPECTRCQGWGAFQEDIQTIIRGSTSSILKLT